MFDHMMFHFIYVNCNDLTATEPWEPWLMREIKLVKYYDLPRLYHIMEHYCHHGTTAVYDCHYHYLIILLIISTSTVYHHDVYPLVN